MARAFFALPYEEKCAIDVKRSNCFRGYEPFGTQTIDRTAPGDLKEGFIMGPDLDANHPHVTAGYPNSGTNLWPARPVAFRAQFETYVTAMNLLGRRLSRSIALSLDLPEHYFSDGLREPLTYSQMFHYPPVSKDASPQIGAGAHVDWGMLTLLLQDDVGGLEVRMADGSWIAAPPIPGTLVILLGEMMLRFTNGAYRSATHRVAKNTGDRSRYSMPTFFDPDYDYRIACVPSCRRAGAEPAFPALTVAEHMRQMATATLSARLSA
jgi:isopenicillin N synthase-like dioxygenase